MSSPHGMTDMEKLAHLLSHWQEHNNDHKASYLDWADKADKAGHAEAARLLREAAAATDQVTALFAQAAAALS